MLLDTHRGRRMILEMRFIELVRLRFDAMGRTLCRRGIDANIASRQGCHPISPFIVKAVAEDAGDEKSDRCGNDTSTNQGSIRVTFSRYSFGYGKRTKQGADNKTHAQQKPLNAPFARFVDKAVVHRTDTLCGGVAGVKIPTSVNLFKAIAAGP